ncbi:MAG: TMAO reductase system periplasmic protein TorT [Methylocystaceae bacterium]|nr:TMAO reductase system periplasmic protein TorT [Methylocystaceae bacterium]
MLLKSTFSLLSLALAFSTQALAQEWTVNKWDPAFKFENSEKITYTALDKASKKWKLCVVFPHLKDPYWAATNYGVASHAKKLGVAMDLFEAGGYPNLDKQIEQVKNCAAGDYDAILLGSVSIDKMTPTIVEAAKSKPVFATVNYVQGDGITGMVSVDWTNMGRAAGDYFKTTYPKGGTPVKVAWIPGPETAGWVKVTDKGFREAIADSAVELVTTKYGDTGADIQAAFVAEVLEEHPDVQYIAGNAVAIESALSVLRRKKIDSVSLVADYFTPAMYRGIRRGKLASAPSDSAALQGVLSVDQAVRYLEGKTIAKHIGPVIFNVTKDNFKSFPVDESLAPSDFKNVFSVK